MQSYDEKTLSPIAISSWTFKIIFRFFVLIKKWIRYYSGEEIDASFIFLILDPIALIRVDDQDCGMMYLAMETLPCHPMRRSFFIPDDPVEFVDFLQISLVIICIINISRLSEYVFPTYDLEMLIELDFSSTPLLSGVEKSNIPINDIVPSVQAFFLKLCTLWRGKTSTYSLHALFIHQSQSSGWRPYGWLAVGSLDDVATVVSSNGRAPRMAPLRSVVRTITRIGGLQAAMSPHCQEWRGRLPHFSRASLKSTLLFRYSR
ncbi:MAG: hypothetical protein E7317_00420 [Clostridiales bacterium]|nr:hypothetical protein [Clostridiales bacterium]